MGASLAAPFSVPHICEFKSREMRLEMGSRLLSQLAMPQGKIRSVDGVVEVSDFVGRCQFNG